MSSSPIGTASPSFLPPYPAWARAAAAADSLPALQAGAGLAMISLLLAADGPARGVWLDRLALRATAACLAAAGRPDEEGAVRDALHLTRPGADPGPAGRLFETWRAFTRRTPTAEPAAEPPTDPLAAAAAAAGHAARPRQPEKALLAADAALAAGVGWPCGVPLLALAARPRAPLGGDPAAVAVACARATALAWDLHLHLDRRARALRTIASRLRAKGAPAVIEALCSQDSLTARRLPGGLSDRAGRRLFDRLTGLGVVDELTGRAEFRCYGL